MPLVFKSVFHITNKVFYLKQKWKHDLLCLNVLMSSRPPQDKAKMHRWPTSPPWFSHDLVLSSTSHSHFYFLTPNLINALTREDEAYLHISTMPSLHFLTALLPFICYSLVQMQRSLGAFGKCSNWVIYMLYASFISKTLSPLYTLLLMFSKAGTMCHT